jgi:hypothetical protein
MKIANTEQAESAIVNAQITSYVPGTVNWHGDTRS